MAESTFPIDFIARVIDLSKRHVHQLVSDGVIPRHEHGRYELIPVVNAYIKFLRTRAAVGDTGSDAYTLHRARLTAARADMAEMESEQMRGHLIPDVDVEQTWGVIASTVRTQLLGLPTKLAPQVTSMTTVEAEGLIREEISTILNELADGHVDVTEPLLASEGTPSDRKVDDEGAGPSPDAAESDRQPVGRSRTTPQSRSQRRSGAVANSAG